MSEAVIDATELGLAQTRKRHVLIACKGGAADVEAAVRALKRPPRPLSWAIEDLMDTESDDPIDRPAALSDENTRRRTLTPREAARIQGFSDRFQFNLINGESPTRTALAKMIGDAVPPRIGCAAAVAALAALNAKPANVPPETAG